MNRAFGNALQLSFMKNISEPITNSREDLKAHRDGFLTEAKSIAFSRF
jgi:hypothetical protein